MKLCTPVIAILAMISQLATSPSVDYSHPSFDDGISTQENQRTEVNNVLGFDINLYAERIAEVESGFDETAISQSGSYIGLYQIGDLALKDIEMYPEISVRKFKRDPSTFSVETQMIALVKIAEKNERYLYKWIHKYDGQTVGGYQITKAGMLAAAHHVGASQVKDFLRSGGVDIASDGNGLKMTTMINEMRDGCL